MCDTAERDEYQKHSTRGVKKEKSNPADLHWVLLKKENGPKTSDLLIEHSTCVSSLVTDQKDLVDLQWEQESVTERCQLNT